MTADAITHTTDIDTELQALFASLEALNERYSSINTGEDLQELESDARMISLKISAWFKGR